MRRGRPLDPLVLTTSERETLTQWARRPTTAQALRRTVIPDGWASLPDFDHWVKGVLDHLAEDG